MSGFIARQNLRPIISSARCDCPQSPNPLLDKEASPGGAGRLDWRRSRLRLTGDRRTKGGPHRVRPRGIGAALQNEARPC
jgi:hypothetical protein